MKRLALVGLLILLAATAASFVLAPAPLLEPAEELTLEEKVGQIFMIGIEGKTLSEETERLIRKTKPGSVLLLGRNIGTPEELRELTSSLQKISIEETGLPLFVAIDQEGGEVSRISWVEKTSQSEIKTESQAYDIGKEKADQLRLLGINLNLAPLLDKLSPEDFIYNRGFQNNKGNFGEKIIQGQKDGGILSCAKHFPGYGGITYHPEDNLAFAEAVPDYSEFEKSAEEADMVMVSNVVYKELDKNYPFSFLKEGIGLLKEKVSGEYLVVSDDLAQYSLLGNFSLEEILSKPVNAGVDILIFSGWRSPVEEAVARAVKAAEDGLIEKNRLQEAVSKIIKAKEKYFNL